VSFELAVFIPKPPQDLEARWCAALRLHGLDCEFYPRFALQTWQGGYLPIRFVVTNEAAFPQAARYGNQPLVAGFEVDALRVKRSELPKGLPKAVLASLSSGYYVSFRTPMGRSVADFRLQYYCAITLATTLDGLYCDLQSGAAVPASEALEAVRKEAESYEAPPFRRRGWDLVPFPGWKVISRGGA